MLIITALLTTYLACRSREPKSAHGRRTIDAAGRLKKIYMVEQLNFRAILLWLKTVLVTVK